MADIIRNYVVEFAAFSATAPTTWTKIEDAIRSIPNLFPVPDAVDVSVVTNSRPTSIPGIAKSEAYTFKVVPDQAFLTAHAAMVSDQNDAAKGYFWMRITFPQRGYTVTFKAKTVDYLATPSGQLGAADEIDWPVYPQNDPDKEPISTPSKSGS